VLTNVRRLELTARPQTAMLQPGYFNSTNYYVDRVSRKRATSAKKRYFAGTIYAIAMSELGHIFGSLCVTPISRVAYLLRHSEVLLAEGFMNEKLETIGEAFHYIHSHGGLFRGAFLRAALAIFADVLINIYYLLSSC